MLRQVGDYQCSCVHRSPLTFADEGEHKNAVDACTAGQDPRQLFLSGRKVIFHTKPCVTIRNTSKHYKDVLQQTKS